MDGPMIKVNDSSIPSFVRWIDEDYVDQAYKRITAKISEETICRDALSIDFNTLVYDNYRDLVTAFERIGLKNDMYKEHSFYNNKHIIAARVQDYIFDCMGEIKPIFEYVTKTQKPEFWVDYPWTKLISRTINKGYTEMSILKATVIIKHYTDNPIEFIPENFDRIKRILTYTPYWEFGFENRVYGWDESPKKFRIANKARAKEIAAQDLFVNAVLKDNDFEYAYDLIKDRDDKD